MNEPVTEVAGQSQNGSLEPRGKRKDRAQNSSAEVPEKVPEKQKETTGKLPEKPEVERNKKNDFPVVDDLFSDSDFDSDFDLYGKVDSKKWRIEKKFYEKQDGTIMLYYNYRRRKGRYVKGKRVNVYKKGGKKVWRSNTN